MQAGKGMPNINRVPIKEKQVKYRHEAVEHANSFYGSNAWKRLRNTYLSTHPVCECCLEHNKVNPAEHVHHKTPWDRGETEAEKWELFLKESNLMSVCSKCHLGLHNKDRQYHLGSLDSLTDSEYRYIHGLNYRNE